MNILDYKQWILAGVFVVAAIAGFKFWESRLIEQGREEMRQVYAANALKATQAARKQEADWQLKKDGALNAATKRTQTDSAYRVAAERTINSLREQIADANKRMSTASVEAIRQYSATLGAVFEDCTRAYSEMEAAASGHANDSLMLQESWPKEGWVAGADPGIT